MGFQSVSIDFSHFRSLSVTFNHFQSLPGTLNHFDLVKKTHECIDIWKLGKTILKMHGQKEIHDLFRKMFDM